jgi:hypothetical protein
MDTWSAKRDQSSFWTLQIHVELCVCVHWYTVQQQQHESAEWADLRH